jgi:hypothetical protein
MIQFHIYKYGFLASSEPKLREHQATQEQTSRSSGLEGDQTMSAACTFSSLTSLVVEQMN